MDQCRITISSRMFMLILSLIIASPSMTAAKTGLVIESRLENFIQCPFNKNTTIIFKDNYIKRISARESRLFGKMIVQEPIKYLTGKVEMFKCASKSEPDTCEYYTRFQYNDVCDYLNNKRDPWYSYINGTTMPNKCPFTKGAFQVKGIKIGFTKAFPLFAGFWKFRNKGYDENNKLVVCFLMEMNIMSRFKV